MTGCGHNHRLPTPTGTKDPACQALENSGSGRTQDAAQGCLRLAVMTTGDVAQTGELERPRRLSRRGPTRRARRVLRAWEYLGLKAGSGTKSRRTRTYTSANDAANIGLWHRHHRSRCNRRREVQRARGPGPDLRGRRHWRVAGNFGVAVGFIFVEGDCDITGPRGILGAICRAGARRPVAFAAGNSTVFYSRDAINQWVGGNMGYQTLAWNEPEKTRDPGRGSKRGAAGWTGRPAP